MKTKRADQPWERSYNEARAEEELEQAQRASHPGAVRSHYLLAGFYLDRIYGAASAEAQPSD